MSLFTPEQIHAAWESLPPELQSTPLTRARTSGLSLKLESLQSVGSYKVRAAYTRLQHCRSQADGKSRVALSSSGNFASAFSWAAQRLGVEAHLVVTPSVNPQKMKLARLHPCEIHTSGRSYESRFRTLEQLAKDGIETIDHRTDHQVFLGHATIGWECLSYSDQFQRVLIPVSTGGLALGVATALRAGGFEGEILGVQPAGNPTLYDSWQAQRPMKRDRIDTICDALTATSIPPETFQHLQNVLDDILVVQEESVLRSVGYMALEEGIVAEPGACVGIAALLELQRPWKDSLCLITGRNMERSMLERGMEAWQLAEVLV